MIRELTASQLAEWQAFSLLEPFETEKSDYKFSYLYSVLTNLVIRSMGKRGAKLTSVEDFSLAWDPEDAIPKQQSIYQMKDMFRMIASDSKEKEDFNNKRIRRKPKHLKK